MEVIYSLQNKKIKEISKLKQKKYRDESDFFVIETPHLIQEAKKSGLLEFIISSDEKDKPDILVNKNILKKLSNLESPNIIGVCKKLDRNFLGEKVIILNNIQDPGNFGTIIRSAVAFDIDTIIFDDKCVDLYNPKTILSSQGMIFKMNFIKSYNLSIIDKLKKSNYKIYATDVNEGCSLKNVKKPDYYAIILGNEGNGISKEIIQKADEKINIKINQTCESLNVGVAASIILYEFNR